MAVSILRVSLVSPDPAGDIAQRLVFPAGDGRHAARVLSQYFAGAAGGYRDCKFAVAVETSTSSTTQAANTITITHANVSDGDTITIGGRVITAKTAGANQNEWTIGANATADGVALAACINAHTELKSFLSASAASGVVTVTCLVDGLIGKHVTLATSDGTAFAFGGGTGSLVLSTSPTVQSTSRQHNRGF